jgi:hypothetical protein
VESHIEAALVRVTTAPQGLDASGGTVSQSSPTVLASGPLTRSGDSLTVELHRPLDSPNFVLVVWPMKPSITAPTPKALAALAAAMVRTLAEAQAELATKIRNSR